MLLNIRWIESQLHKRLVGKINEDGRIHVSVGHIVNDGVKHGTIIVVILLNW